MKMKKVYSQMTKSPYITLLNNAYLNEHGELITGEQWISNGKAAYILEGLPQFGADNVLNLLAVPEKNRGKYSVCEESVRLENGDIELIYRDSDDADIIVTPMCELFSDTVMVSDDKQTVVFVSDNFVDVFADDDTTYILRTSGETRYVAARCGLITKGVVISDDFRSSETAQKAIDRLRIIIKEIDREKALT